jgi:peptide/nickel transport system ATP-binding protein
VRRDHADALPILEVRDLSISFGKVEVVSHIDFSLQSGEKFALVGESGSGKSTAALSLLRLLPQYARVTGQVLLHGDDVLALPLSSLRRRRGADIAMIFQDPSGSLNPLMTIGDQIGESLSLHLGLSRRTARARAVALLDQVHIPEPQREVNSYPQQLSRGMKQRAMIAMAIACEPKLLIADEPTTALDAPLRGAMLNLLDQLQRDMSLGILLISHDLGLVGRWADRIAVMYAGRICEEGTADELFRAPRHPYSRGLLAASPLFSAVSHYTEGRLKEIPGFPVRSTGTEGCAFAPRCSDAQPACWSVPPPLVAIDSPGFHRLACPVAVMPEKAHAAAAAE